MASRVIFILSANWFVVLAGFSCESQVGSKRNADSWSGFFTVTVTVCSNIAHPHPILLSRQLSLLLAASRDNTCKKELVELLLLPELHTALLG
jgi:hypothetical protein